jgi:hypothetical protein|nr:MAG TPA: Integrase [Caudoviricetes sp.]
MDYHVFKKPKIKNGKKIYKWYYYYTQNGKQIQKACKNCNNRSDAESYIRSLPPLQNKSASITVKDIAQTMFLTGSDHVSRRSQLGLSVLLETLQISRGYVEQIIEKWGTYDIRTLNPKEIMQYLFTVKRSGSWKNSYLSVFSEIFQEAMWFDCAVVKPLFRTFVRHSKKADILTTEELNLLFKEDNFPNEMMYLFFLLCLSAGMRLGEVRAVRVKQFIFDQKILIIDGFCKKEGERTVYNKAGSVDKPKLRMVYLPDMTIKIMQKWIGDNNLCADDFCFTQNGRPVRTEYAEKVFYRALQKIDLIPHGKGIKRLAPADGRKLVPHSLRYTYVSRMRRVMSAEDLKNYTGHTSTAMVDYYSHRSVELLLEGLPESGKRAANTLFS